MRRDFKNPTRAVADIRSGSLSHAEKALAIAAISKARSCSSAALASELEMRSYTVRQYKLIGTKLADELLCQLHDGLITFSMARTLAALDAETQVEKAGTFKALGFSVKKARDNLAERSIDVGRKELTRFYEQLAMKISDQIGIPTKVVPSRTLSQGGEVRLIFTDYQDFDLIMDRLRVRLEELE